MARFSSGWFGSVASSRHAEGEMPSAKIFGSNAGLRAVAVADRRLGRTLEVEVDGHHDAVAGTLGNLAQQAQAAADRVNLDFLAAGGAAQRRFKAPFEAELSDFVAHPVVGQPVEILERDFADIAQQMRGERTVE